MNLQKIGIIGCGDVGSACAYALMDSGLFTTLVLIDRNREKADGEAMDLSHCLPFIKPMEIIAGDYPDLRNCGIVVITAGAPQTSNQTRLDVIEKNAHILSSIVPQIVKYNTDCIILVVSNPVDALAHITRELSGFPVSRVIGSGTVLDTARFKYLLGKHLAVDPRSVHAFIIGEHGDSELAVWSSAAVGGIALSRFCDQRGFSEDNRAETRARIYEEVRNSAYEIIKRKGSTYYGISYAVRRICESIVRDEHSIMPVSNLITGHYGVNETYISAPALVGSNGVEAIFEIDLSPDELSAFTASAKILKSATMSVLSKLKTD